MGFSTTTSVDRHAVGDVSLQVAIVKMSLSTSHRLCFSREYKKNVAKISQLFRLCDLHCRIPEVKPHPENYCCLTVADCLGYFTSFILILTRLWYN
eukprot:UN08230